MVLKSIFDYTLALILLPFLLPVILILAFISSCDTGKFGIFSQKRVGRNGVPFSIYKIRSMRNNAGILLQDQKYVTKIGDFLRKSKLDELPQIFNILLGQMSFVGPRPDVAGYADKLKGNDRLMLSVKPGITGPAQLAFKNEEMLLQKKENPLKYNDEVLWPQKVGINNDYVKSWSFFKDMHYILKTIF